MTKEELQNLLAQVQINQSESRTLELKSAHSGCPKRLYDTLSSFSNQDDGGIILFGIDEDNGYAEVGVYDVQDLQKQVNAQCLQMEPVVRPVLTSVRKEKRYFVSAEIPGMDLADRPCYYRGAGRLKGSYTRVGDSDEPMTEYEIYSYEAFRRKYHDEICEVERADLDDLDQARLMEYLKRLQEGKPHFASFSQDRMYKLANVLRNSKVTLWAEMLFGIYPQEYFPQLCVTAVSIPGKEIVDIPTDGPRFLDNLRITGNIVEILQGTMQFIQRNLRSEAYINLQTGLREERLELPMEAIREAVLNALVHRDYSIHTQGMPIQVRLFTNRLEIHSPGGLYGRLQINQLGHVQPDTRNPVLANAMELLNITENRYTGIPIMQKNMKEYGLPAATFRDSRGSFVVTFYRRSVENKDDNSLHQDSRIKGLLKFCQQSRSKKEIAEYLQIRSLGYVAKRYIKPLVKEGILKETLPDNPRSHKQRYYTEHCHK